MYFWLISFSSSEALNENRRALESGHVVLRKNTRPLHVIKNLLIRRFYIAQKLKLQYHSVMALLFLSPILHFMLKANTSKLLLF